MKKIRKSFSMNDDYVQKTYNIQEIENPVEVITFMESDNAWGLSDQVDQVVQGLSGLQAAGQIYLADVGSLEGYPNQPFLQYSPDKLQELAEDIRRVGILSPILVRKLRNRLQILSGHNRWQAAKLAGFQQVPILILEVEDDEAILVLTSTNLRQRERLLPSEKAFAYKMQLDALKRQGQRTADGGVYDASVFLTQQTGDSRTQINRYIRLTDLEPGLLQMLDDGRISMTPAVHVSALRQEEQKILLRLLEERGDCLSIERSAMLRSASEEQAEGLSEAEILAILEGRKQKPQSIFSKKYIKLPTARIRELVPKDVAEEMVEEYILDAIWMRVEEGKG